MAGLKPCNFIQNRPQHRFSLWILQNFKEHLVWRTFANRHFCLFQVNSLKHLKKSILKPKRHNKFENTLHAAQFMKRNHWNVPLCIFMFSCTNVYYRHAQTTHIGSWISNNLYEIYPDMNFISFLNIKHLDKLDQKAIWLSSVSYRSKAKSKNLDKMHQNQIYRLLAARIRMEWISRLLLYEVTRKLCKIVRSF